LRSGLLGRVERNEEDRPEGGCSLVCVGQADDELIRSDGSGVQKQEMNQGVPGVVDLDDCAISEVDLQVGDLEIARLVILVGVLVDVSTGPEVVFLVPFVDHKDGSCTHETRGDEQ